MDLTCWMKWYHIQRNMRRLQKIGRFCYHYNMLIGNIIDGSEADMLKQFEKNPEGIQNGRRFV